MNSENWYVYGKMELHIDIISLITFTWSQRWSIRRFCLFSYTFFHMPTHVSFKMIYIFIKSNNWRVHIRCTSLELYSFLPNCISIDKCWIKSDVFSCFFCTNLDSLVIAEYKLLGLCEWQWRQTTVHNKNRLRIVFFSSNIWAILGNDIDIRHRVSNTAKTIHRKVTIFFSL